MSDVVLALRIFPVFELAVAVLLAVVWSIFICHAPVW